MAPELRTLELTDNYASTNVGPFQSSSPFPWLLPLVGVWAAGIVLLVGRAAWNYIRVVRQMPPLAEVDSEWAGEWAELQRQAGMRRFVPLAVAEHVGPVLFRLPRGYRLIVPAAAWGSLERSQRLSILRHELAHIERRDVWKSLAVRALALPHWFNPLVWHCVRRFDECAEWACDEAARRGAPEHVPDYARALLQLVQRAEPVFFATRAAREHGLSHRIRRLLTPAQEKGSAMKTAVLFACVLGISLLNLTRLQTRADDESPLAVDLTITAAPQVTGSTVTLTATSAAPPRASTPGAPAAATTAVVNASPAVAVSPAVAPANAAIPSAITITATPAAVPATTATSTSTTPAAASAQSAITILGVTPSVATVAQPAALPAPVDSTLAQPATAPAAAPATIALPAAPDPFVAPARASTPAANPSNAPSATSPPAATANGIRAAVATPPSWGVPVADPTAQVTLFNTSVSSEPQQARADLGSILKNMQEFQSGLQALEAEDVTWRTTQANARDEMVKAARLRIEAEKDPLIKDLLEKGVAQKKAEMKHQVNPKLAERANVLRNQMLAKIVAEIAGYSQEHRLLVVRRADFARPQAGLLRINVPLNIVMGVTGRPVPPGTVLGELKSASNSDTWDQEVLYVAGRDGQHESDISDEIVKRLNAAYTAYQTQGGKKSPQ